MTQLLAECRKESACMLRCQVILLVRYQPAHNCMPVQLELNGSAT